MTDDLVIVSRFVLVLAVVIGCFVCILKRPETEVRTAAFSLLGVIASTIAANTAKTSAGT